MKTSETSVGDGDRAAGREYPPDWFAGRAAGVSASAEQIVPRMMELAAPDSVVDVGCGTGGWLATFQRFGVQRVLGLDGDWVPRGQMEIKPEDFRVTDLRERIRLTDSFDLAVSLEVAEHLPESSAPDFVKGLTDLAPTVLFSAAIPGQPGHGHINVQWPAYWISKFQENGFVAVDAIRPWIWGNDSVKYFYQQNILVFVERDALMAMPALAQLHAAAPGAPQAMVHPRLYEVYLRRDPRSKVPRWMRSWAARLRTNS